VRCLIDADILLYEVSSGGQYKGEEGELAYRQFEGVAEHLDQKIKEIEGEVGADEESLLFLTTSEAVNKKLNRIRKERGEPTQKFKPNFRIKTAKTKPYKGTRKAEKPFHFENLLAYMVDKFNVVVYEGMEADDALCIHQTKRLEQDDTTICSRDKDLRICEGNHFGWACHNQLQYGPRLVSRIGELEFIGKKIRGCGLKFFYSQLLTGDAIDNIGGLSRCGPTGAIKILEGCETEEELFKAVVGAYQAKLGDGWKEAIKEQGDLLWMVNKVTKKGKPVKWSKTTLKEGIKKWLVKEES